MGDVKRYAADEQYPGQYSARCDLVAASDFDAALAREAALRQNLEFAQEASVAFAEEADAAKFELAALREELAVATRNEHNSEVAYKAAIEKQGELRAEFDDYKNAKSIPNKTLAWRGVNEYDEVVTDWIEGEAPETMYDLQDRPAHYHKIERAYSAPETELVAVVEYTGYEPSNSLKWLNKGLGHMKPGTKLYAVQPTESGASDRTIRDLANDIIDGALSGASE